MVKKLRTEEDYYNESRRLRAETMLIADSLRERPLRFTITNGIVMEVEITKSDLKTIVSKNTKVSPAFSKAAGSMGQSPWSPSADGEIP